MPFGKVSSIQIQGWYFQSGDLLLISVCEKPYLVQQKHLILLLNTVQRMISSIKQLLQSQAGLKNTFLLAEIIIKLVISKLLQVKGSTTSELARQPETTTNSSSDGNNSGSDVTVKTPANEQTSASTPGSSSSESATTPATTPSDGDASSQGGVTIDKPTPSSSTRGKSRVNVAKCRVFHHII